VKIFPDKRLLKAVVVWSATSMAAVLAPAMTLAVAGALVLLFGLTLWDRLLLRRVLPIRVERRLPERAYVGRTSEVVLILENGNGFGVELNVMDELPSDLVAEDPFFPRVHVQARGSTTLRYPIRPSLRGDRELGPVVTLLRSPLGLLRRRMVAGAGEAVRVYPDASRYLRPEALDPKNVLAALGARPERRRGEGLEFESLRDYVPGDDPRRLDWTASARRGKPVVRLHQHERNHTVLLAIDASRLMGGQVTARTKLDYAVDASLALAYAALASGDRLGMAVFDRTVRALLSPRSRSRHLGEFVDLLRLVHPHLVEASYGELARNLAIRQRQRALLVIFTDFVETDVRSITEPLTMLAKRHRVLLVAIRDRIYEELEAGSEEGVEKRLGLYRRLVLNDLLVERETVLATLRRRGLQTLDLTPEEMTASVLNRYLEIRYGSAG
jgi:uncharacterized protein (DUF58 family)